MGVDDSRLRGSVIEGSQRHQRVTSNSLLGSYISKAVKKVQGISSSLLSAFPMDFLHIQAVFLSSRIPLKPLTSPFPRAALSTIFSPSPVLFSRVQRQSLDLQKAEDGSRLQLNQIFINEFIRRQDFLVFSYI